VPDLWRDHSAPAPACGTNSGPVAHPPHGDLLLAVERVSKKFCRTLRRSLLYGLADIAGELTGGSARTALRPGEFWALGDVSFTLQRGQSLALVGPNGAGKTTLLRIISGLIRPDTGSITARGRLAPLIALGAGFNPVLTGRENIYVNMSILGLGRKDINARFDAVVEFAEIGHALDAPVQSYSAGMTARLGFACAIHTDPDVLLIDEVLAVGDIKFRMKCYRRLAELRQSGTAFVLVSHSPAAVLSACDTGLYLNEGRPVCLGDAATVIGQYEEDLLAAGSPAATASVLRRPAGIAEPSGGAEILSISFKNDAGEYFDSPTTGDPVLVCVRCRVAASIEQLGLVVAISSASLENQRVLYLDSDHDGQSLKCLPGENEIQLELPYCGLNPGFYDAKIVLKQDSLSMLDVVESFRFRVRSRTSIDQNLFYQPRRWTVNHVQS
jgi:lipopolysaccharide transport system ATP-binding protein